MSRKFVYQQAHKAQQALDESFNSAADEAEVLFHLPVTKTWLFQLILALVLICHSSYRGIVELFRDLFDLHISIGTIHNRLQSASTIASGINESQDLSGIDVGLHDEIFQGSQPVLAGVDAASTYCYLLQGVEKRDEDTWGWYLLESMEQGFAPEYTIGDGGQGLRAGQKAVMPETPCHGDVFHMQRQFARVANSLSRQAKGATSRRRQLEQQMAKARLTHQVTRQMRSRLGHARQKEQKLVSLARDLKTLLQWLCHDVFELAGPSLEVREELYDFIATELQKLECKQHSAIRKLRKALRKQRDNLLAFAGVLDRKLAAIAHSFNLPLQTVREVCLLFRKRPTSNPYWERWNQLQTQLSGQFHGVMEAVAGALQTPRASSLVENLNSRLRNYFFLRRSLNDSYLSLLQFFLNHRRFIRSQVAERVGKSPKEIMTGDAHPHWLEMLGFQRFQRV